jgi:hypothetical protein
LKIPARFRNVILAVVVGALAACSSQGPSGASQPFFNPDRITVQDLAVEPSPAAPGSPSQIRFRLVRTADPDAPIYWTAYFLERPDAGGRLSALSGGPVRSGAVVQLAYVPAAVTTAFVTVYPASAPGLATGDGSGDWRSFTIEVPSR